jgi:hypothetical protein
MTLLKTHLAFYPTHTGGYIPWRLKAAEEWRLNTGIVFIRSLQELKDKVVHESVMEE